MQELGLDHQEVEWQFDAPDLGAVSRWLDERDSGKEPSVEAGETREITDTYYDTDDWCLYRAGYALRVRRKKGAGAEATMKFLARAEESGVKRRREISEPLGSPDLRNLSKDSGPVGERLHYLAGPKALRTLFEIKTRRSTYGLGFDGTDAGELVLDETTVPGEDGSDPVSFDRVEVEVEPEAFSSFEPFVEELRQGSGLSPATNSKYRAGLLARKLEPPELPDLGSTEVNVSLSVGEVAFAVLREQFRVFLARESGARLGEDPEELHDVRVASRRMRAAMRIFAEVLPEQVRELEGELRWVAQRLGDVRDLDVQLDRLERWISEAAPEDRELLASLGAVLQERREKARSQMLQALNSRRYARFVESFSELLKRGPSCHSKAAQRPILEVGPALVRKRYRKVRKIGDGITPDSPPEDYHRLRKRGKRLRYALEFLSNVYGKPAENLVKALKNLQDVLGDHQDAVVAAGYLRELSVKRGGNRKLPPEAVFVMGGIARRYQERAEELRAQFPEVYDKIKGKRWKKLNKVMGGE